MNTLDQTPRSTVEDVFARRAKWCLVCAEAEAWLKTLPTWSIGGGLLDPPYGLGSREPTPQELLAYLQGSSLDTGGDFMGERWEIPPVSLWRELLRAFKPGAYLAISTSTSTDDLIGMGLRMAGWERRGAFELIGTGRIGWVNGQGMVKGSTVDKAIDEAAGVDREVVGSQVLMGNAALSCREKGGTFAAATECRGLKKEIEVTAATSELAKRFNGYRTEISPKHEPVLLFRAPFVSVTSQQIYAATGWDSWHIVTKANEPDQRAKVAARYGVDVPDGGECQVRRKRPLHDGAEEYHEVRHREHGGPWVVLKETTKTPYKPWKIATAASNALVYGTGAMNAEASRVWTDWSDRSDSWKRSGHSAKPEAKKIAGRPPGNGIVCHPEGRSCPDVWLVHQPECREVGQGGDTSGATTYACLATCPGGHEIVTPSGGDPPTCACGLPTAWACSVARMDQVAGLRKSGSRAAGVRKGMGYHGGSGDGGPAIQGSEGFVSRYFHQFAPEQEPFIYDPKANPTERHAGGRNSHPCVKPGAVRPNGLLRRLWRLILPPWEVGVDCFAGSGSGPAAAAAEGLHVIACEMDPKYVDYAHVRIPALLAMARANDKKVMARTSRREPATTEKQPLLFQ